MAQIHIQIIVPNAIKLDDMVDSIFVPGCEGDFEIMYDHAPIITKLRPGTVEVNKGKEADCFAMYDGFITVEDNHVLILTESCESKNEINLEEAIHDKEQAEKDIATVGKGNNLDYMKAQAALMKAVARINTAKHS